MKMLMKLASVLAALLAFASLAFADPQGFYIVNGENPDGSEYGGTVSVERTGETYAVTWDIGGTIFEGTALGAAPVKGMTIMGPADENDYVLTVGYVSGPDNFGIAYYIEQDDGTWQGIWAFGGSDIVATESWVRAE